MATHLIRILAVAGLACLSPYLAHAQSSGANGSGDMAGSKDGEARSAIEQCLAGAGAQDPQSCIGTYAQSCGESEEGQTTQGMTDCIGQETDAWDALLNENYEARMTEAKSLDAERDAEGVLSDNEAAPLLRKAQRAWIAYRDAECDRIFELSKDGTIRLPETASCTNRLTAERALALGDDQP
ncbi:DUF1311 domain-containing protein [Fulvimarina endophytica]|uniref:DUF1311 domain-containing protein n=1 Tax=Fulvimarina endophytica TaxID=2293836 RepID=A0A371X6X4_9HYPH|nr:lysozyme inhibitor LprI family protein [Fulvimarina endophytica]RFC64966.1 DUF1311 domain-containing protein [Fulvimarina endophytica]